VGELVLDLEGLTHHGAAPAQSKPQLLQKEGAGPLYRSVAPRTPLGADGAAVAPGMSFVYEAEADATPSTCSGRPWRVHG